MSPVWMSVYQISSFSVSRPGSAWWKSDPDTAHTTSPLPGPGTVRLAQESRLLARSAPLWGRSRRGMPLPSGGDAFPHAATQLRPPPWARLRVVALCLNSLWPIHVQAVVAGQLFLCDTDSSLRVGAGVGCARVRAHEWGLQEQAAMSTSRSPNKSFTGRTPRRTPKTPRTAGFT